MDSQNSSKQTFHREYCVGKLYSIFLLYNITFIKNGNRIGERGWGFFFMAMSPMIISMSCPQFSGKCRPVQHTLNSGYEIRYPDCKWKNGAHTQIHPGLWTVPPWIWTVICNDQYYLIQTHSTQQWGGLLQRSFPWSRQGAIFILYGWFFARLFAGRGRFT